MLNEWWLAIRPKQMRPRGGQPKKFTLRPEAGTREEMKKALAEINELLCSELYRPLILSSPSPAAAWAAARAGKVLVLVLGMGQEIVIEMPGVEKLTTKQPAHGVAWHAGVPKPKRFVIRRPGRLAVTVTMKEPAGWPRGKGRPRREPGIKKLQIPHSLLGCFQKTGVTKRQERVAVAFLDHLWRWLGEKQQWQAKKKRAGGHRPCAPQQATASEFRVSEAYVSQTLNAVDKKMRKRWPNFSIRRPTLADLPTRSPH